MKAILLKEKRKHSDNVILNVDQIESIRKYYSTRSNADYCKIKMISGDTYIVKDTVQRLFMIIDELNRINSDE